jgi:hypothetical protein
VLHIDEKAQLVKVDNAGTVQTLTFTNDTPKVAGGAAPGMPGVPAVPGFRTGSRFPPAGFGGGMRSIPGRPLRLPPGTSDSTSTGVGGAGAAMAGANQPAPGTMAALAQEQTALGTGAAGATAGAQQQTGPQRSLEENVLLYEASRLQNQQLAQQGVRLPPMPQHPLASGLDGGPAQPATPAPQAAPAPLARPGMPQLPQ